MGTNWKMFFGSLLTSFLVFGFIFNLPKVIEAAQNTDSATLDGGPSVTVTPGATINAAVTGTITSNDDWGSTQWLISTTPPGATSCENTGNHNNNNGTYTENLSITAPLTPGVYNVYFLINDHASNCSGTSGSLLTLPGAVTVSSENPAPSPSTQKKVTICHSNNGNGSGWTSNSVNDDAIDGISNGNGGADHNQDGHQDGEDIIPPTYEDGSTGNWTPRNWDATGQAIWNNRCSVASSTEPSPTPLAFACNSINVNPAFGPNGKFEFGQTYDFSANITGSATSYTWSVNPSSPVLSSTNGTTTSWTAPLTANPSITWVLTLNVSDESQNQSSCQIEFRDPADDVCANIDGFQTSVPNGLHLDASGRNCVSFELGGPPPTNGGGGQVLGASTGKVLGASTTAKAGTSEDMIGLVLVFSGTILVGTSFNAYRKVYAQ